MGARGRPDGHAVDVPLVEHRRVRVVREEMAKFLYDYGVDAVFTDNPDQFPRR